MIDIGAARAGVDARAVPRSGSLGPSVIACGRLTHSGADDGTFVRVPEMRPRRPQGLLRRSDGTCNAFTERAYGAPHMQDKVEHADDAQAVCKYAVHRCTPEKVAKDLLESTLPILPVHGGRPVVRKVRPRR